MLRHSGVSVEQENKMMLREKLHSEGSEVEAGGLLCFAFPLLKRDKDHHPTDIFGKALLGT